MKDDTKLEGILTDGFHGQVRVDSLSRRPGLAGSDPSVAGVFEALKGCECVGDSVNALEGVLRELIQSLADRPIRESVIRFLLRGSTAQLRQLLEAEYDLERCDAKALNHHARCFPHSAV